MHFEREGGGRNWTCLHTPIINVHVILLNVASSLEFVNLWHKVKYMDFSIVVRYEPPPPPLLVFIVSNLFCMNDRDLKLAICKISLNLRQF